jgi:predicted RNA binding protein with dsRBD fold (UPF0201 family)
MLYRFVVEIPPSFPVNKQAAINNRYNSKDIEEMEPLKIALLADQETQAPMQKPSPSSHSAYKS